MAVDLSFFRSETSQRLRAEGRAEGRAQDILLLLDKRGIPVPDEARRRIGECRDPEILETWFLRAVTAVSAEAVVADC